MLRKRTCIDNHIRSSETLKDLGFCQSLSRSPEHLLPDANYIKLMQNTCQETLNSSIKKRMNCVKATTKNRYLLLQGNSIQWYNACQNGVKYKGVVGENFIGCKGWNWIQKQCSSLLEISGGHAEQAFIHFQPILPFPVTTFFKQPVRMVQTVKKQSLTEK